MSKPSIPRGTRDFGPKIMAKRKYILNTIEQVYQSFGFMPLETPAMENLTTLMGKYGAEGDQLLFKILDSGDYAKVSKEKGYMKEHMDLTIKSCFFVKDFFEIFFKELIALIVVDPETDVNNYITNYFENQLDKALLYHDLYLEQTDKILIREFLVINKLGISYEISRYKSGVNLTISNLEETFRLFVENEINPLLIKFYLSLFSSKELQAEISEKGLRYDLTVPLARYVVMNQHEVTFPFKRYQIQPVWRADRPQKGRYREFWQCDADVLGTGSILCEADFVKIYQQVFFKLGLTGYEIRINHRKLLEAVVAKADAAFHFKTITVIIDKADKIGIDGVKNELINLGLKENQTEIILSLLNKQSFNAENIEKIKNNLPESENATKAIADLTQLLQLLDNKTDKVFLDGSLARGLDYYTGCIFEVVPTDVQMGSISGGGRYDDLTGVFGLKGVSGIGISFGIDRIYDVMEELNLFPADGTNFTDVLFCCMDEKAFQYCLPIADELRIHQIKTEVYPDTSKLKKQLDYANSKNIQWAAIIGENEMSNGQVSLKNLVSGEQQMVEKDGLIGKIKNI